MTNTQKLVVGALAFVGAQHTYKTAKAKFEQAKRDLKNNR